MTFNYKRYDRATTNNNREEELGDVPRNAQKSPEEWKCSGSKERILNTRVDGKTVSLFFICNDGIRNSVLYTLAIQRQKLTQDRARYINVDSNIEKKEENVSGNNLDKSPMVS